MDKLSKVTRDFAAIYQHATTFINGVNDRLSEEGIHLTTDLPEIRATRRAPEVQSAEKNFEIHCDNVIISGIQWSLPSATDSLSIKNQITRLRAWILTGLRK